MRGVIGQVIARLGMQQHDQIVAIEHQPRHKGGEHLRRKGDLKHRLRMRANQLVMPAAKFGLQKIGSDPLAQPFGATAAFCRIVVDVGVKVRNCPVAHDPVEAAASIAHLCETIGKPLRKLAANPKLPTGGVGGAGGGGKSVARKRKSFPNKKIPRTVPPPPIEATGAPSPLILPRLVRSAPINVPSAPAM